MALLKVRVRFGADASTPCPVRAQLWHNPSAVPTGAAAPAPLADSVSAAPSLAFDSRATSWHGAIVDVVVFLESEFCDLLSADTSARFFGIFDVVLLALLLLLGSLLKDPLLFEPIASNFEVLLDRRALSKRLR